MSLIGTEKHYGWYSVGQAELAGVYLWTTPDGREVEITCVSSDKNDHGSKWKDISFVGELFQPIRRVKEGKLFSLLNANNSNKETFIETLHKLFNIIDQQKRKELREKDHLHWN